MLAPDRPAIVTDARHATNHQLGVEWPRHGRESRTLERAAFLGGALASGRNDAAAMRRMFLKPPLHSRNYGSGFGTVYTAIYRPVAGTVELAWPGVPPIRQRLDAFVETERRIRFVDGLDPFEAPPSAPARSGAAVSAPDRPERTPAP